MKDDPTLRSPTPVVGVKKSLVPPPQMTVEKAPHQSKTAATMQKTDQIEQIIVKGKFYGNNHNYFASVENSNVSTRTQSIQQRNS